MSFDRLSLVTREYVDRGRSESCPVIDMHGHLGPFTGGYLPAGGENAMFRSLAAAGVARIVCSHHEALVVDVVRGNALMQDAVNRHGDILRGYWVVNPNHKEATKGVPADFAEATGFVGLKFLPDYHSCPVTGERYVSALEYAHDRGLLVLVHTWGGSPFDSPQMLAEVAARYPGATFLMGHSGYGDWEASICIARDYPNVYLDLTAVWVAHDFSMQPAGSGTPTPLLSCLHVNGIIEYMVEIATSRKIVFGTDMPWYSPHYALGAVLFSRIDDEDRHNILHRNAEKLLSGSEINCV